MVALDDHGSVACGRCADGIVVPPSPDAQGVRHWQSFSGSPASGGVELAEPGGARSFLVPPKRRWPLLLAGVLCVAVVALFLPLAAVVLAGVLIIGSGLYVVFARPRRLVFDLAQGDLSATLNGRLVLRAPLTALGKVNVREVRFEFTSYSVVLWLERARLCVVQYDDSAHAEQFARALAERVQIAYEPGIVNDNPRD